MKKSLIFLILFGASITNNTFAQDPWYKGLQDNPQNTLYDKAMKALNQKDYQSSLRYFKELYNAGSKDTAPMEISRFYLYGWDVPVDIKQAFNWKKIAAENGNIEAEYEIGECYRNGIGIEQNYSEGFKWTLKAAEHGFVPAMNNVGLCYHDGEGTIKNDKEAFRWFKLAAEKGDDIAPYSLAKMLYSGIGCDKNEKEADSWMLISAERGYAEAQFIIGTYYEVGDYIVNVPDKNKAIEWYTKAANQGHSEAAIRLQIVKNN